MGTLFWTIAGLLLILSEFVVPQFVVFFFGLGALLNAVLVSVIPGLSQRIPLQLMIWAITSGVSLALLRRYAARWFRGEEISRHEDDDAGKTATVIEDITPTRPGRISFHGTTWTAKTYDDKIASGRTVTILKKEDLSYIVTAGDLLNEESETDKGDQ